MQEFLNGWGSWVLGASVLMFLGSLGGVSCLIIRMPYDYFLKDDVGGQPATRVRHYLWLLLRNVLGLTLVFSGIAMLILPGQGVIVVVLGLSLMSFPGKRKVIRWILERKSVRKTMNWLRLKAKKPPLIFELNLTFKEPQAEVET